MNELSPAAQEVVNAAVGVTEYGKETPLLCARIAAALRAAADQVMPKEDDPSGDWTDIDEARFQLLSIATELEAQ
jgi:hypothetical protein